MTGGEPLKSGVTVWLTGLPSAGKTTIARRCAEALYSAGRRVQVLDGDDLRATLCADLGFSRADRDANVRRTGFVAQLLARHGVVVLVAVIAPYRESRAAVRAHHERCGTRYLEVHVDTPLDVCARRDVKGLYARQRAGTLRGLTGVDDPYETPVHPDLVVSTDRPVGVAAASVLAAIHGPGRPGPVVASERQRKSPPRVTAP
ncbi:MAG: adenylyl-sulfate kinase [Saccharothrix sp.]|nr:adenylyl-sulfate kinase [Saccharothrix sp.]